MKSSRRSFLKAGLALPAVLKASPSLASESKTPETTVSKDSAFDPWVEIHRENLRHNVQEISRRAASRPILAVIKNNGYGMGVANVAQLLEPQPEIFGFAVVKLHEAISLRDAGVRKPILRMGPFDEHNLVDAVARGIMPMVYTPRGPALDKIAAKTQKPVPLHICIDAGIGRVGVPCRDAPPLIRDLAARKSVSIQGTMMAFTEDPDFDKEQLRRFHETCASLEKEGIALGNRHAASSFALFQHPEAFLDMVRPGMATYGIYSENERSASTAIYIPSSPPSPPAIASSKSETKSASKSATSPLSSIGSRARAPKTFPNPAAPLSTTSPCTSIRSCLAAWSRDSRSEVDFFPELEFSHLYHRPVFRKNTPVLLQVSSKR